MRLVEWSLRSSVYRVLLALCLFLPPSITFAQETWCTAKNVTEILWNPNLQPQGTAFYTFNYSVTVGWDCTINRTPSCIVCELDTMHLADAQNNYQWFDSVQTTDSASCGSTGNTNTWNGSCPNMPRGVHHNWKLVLAYKMATPHSGCDDPAGFIVSTTQTKFFVTDP